MVLCFVSPCVATILQPHKLFVMYVVAVSTLRYCMLVSIVLYVVAVSMLRYCMVVSFVLYVVAVSTVRTVCLRHFRKPTDRPTDQYALLCSALSIQLQTD